MDSNSTYLNVPLGELNVIMPVQHLAQCLAQSHSPMWNTVTLWITFTELPTQYIFFFFLCVHTILSKGATWFDWGYKSLIWLQVEQGLVGNQYESMEMRGGCYGHPSKRRGLLWWEVGILEIHFGNRINMTWGHRRSKGRAEKRMTPRFPA